jgi:hypothetical protein
LQLPRIQNDNLPRICFANSSCCLGRIPTGAIRRRHQEIATMFPIFACLLLLPTTPANSPSLVTPVGVTSPATAIKPIALTTASPHLDITLSDLDAAQVGILLGESLPAAMRDRFKGRIGKVFVAIRGDQVTVKAEKIRLIGEWLTRAEGTADLKARTFKMKLWAFGGLVEAEGVLPNELPSRLAVARDQPVAR